MDGNILAKVITRDLSPNDLHCIAILIWRYLKWPDVTTAKALYTVYKTAEQLKTGKNEREAGAQ